MLSEPSVVSKDVPLQITEGMLIGLFNPRILIPPLMTVV